MTHWRWTLVALLAACGDSGNVPGGASFLVPGVTSLAETRVAGHRVTTCPTHPFLPSRVEIARDAAGRKIYESHEYSDAPFPERANSYHYDAQGRLAEVRGD